MAALALALPASATLVLVSANVDGQPGNGGSGDPAFSGDGSYVAFLTRATDLVGGSDGAVHVVRYSTGMYTLPLKIAEPYPNFRCLGCHGESQKFLNSPTMKPMMPDLLSGATSCLGCHGAAHPEQKKVASR